MYQVRLELRGRQIAEAGMKTLDVVNVVEKPAEVRPCFLKVVVLAEVYLFFLERLEKTLGFGIIVRTARLAHARAGPNLAQAGDILGTGVLNASIRMMDQANWRAAGGNRRIQRGQRQARVNVSGQVPADHTAAERI